jgi:hypothetical protein
MQKPWKADEAINRSHVVLIEVERFPLAEGRRAAAHVHHDVDDRAASAASRPISDLKLLPWTIPRPKREWLSSSSKWAKLTPSVTYVQNLSTGSVLRFCQLGVER